MTAITKLTANWKSTMLGLCLLAMSGLHFVKFDDVGNLAMTERDWFGVLTGLIGAVVGILMKDAGSTEAKLPSGEVAAVPSHEIPDDPANKVK